MGGQVGQNSFQHEALLSSLRIGAMSGSSCKFLSVLSFSYYWDLLRSYSYHRRCAELKDFHPPGVGGLLYGGASGVIRSPHPVIHSISCGIHWSACGASFWWLRSNILKVYYEDNASPKQRASASSISGGIAGGGVTKLMGGRLIPGVVIFSLLGYLGQHSYNAIDRWQLERAKTPRKPIAQRIVDSKWIPFKFLSDEDYRGILGEKLLSIEAEIAIVDEKIEELQKAKSDGLLLEGESRSRSPTK